MNFKKLDQLYQQHLRSLQRNPQTLVGIGTCTRDFASHCLSVYDCTDIQLVEPSYFSSYIRWLEERKLSPLTIYSRQRIVRTLFAWATLKGLLLIDPSRNLHRPHPRMLPRGAPTFEQVTALLQAPNQSVWGQRDRALLELLYGTGLRLGEAIALDLIHLDLNQKRLHVQHGKGKRERLIPLGAKLTLILQSYLDQVRPKLLKESINEALWLTSRGTRLGRSQVVYSICYYAKRLGFEISAHTLRHAFATHLLTRGASIVAVQRLLGHVTLQMTSRYTHLVPIDVQESVLSTHPRGRRKKPKLPPKIDP